MEKFFGTIYVTDFTGYAFDASYRKSIREHIYSLYRNKKNCSTKLMFGKKQIKIYADRQAEIIEAAAVIGYYFGQQDNGR